MLSYVLSEVTIAGDATMDTEAKVVTFAML
jgi:hypothetical protein